MVHYDALWCLYADSMLERLPRLRTGGMCVVLHGEREGDVHALLGVYQAERLSTRWNVC